MNPQALLKNPFVIIVLGILIFSVFAGSMTLSVTGANTAGVIEHETATDGGGDLSKTNYVMSWVSGADSETITFQGKIRFTDPFSLPEVKAYRYVVLVNGQEVLTNPANTNANDWESWTQTTGAYIEVDTWYYYQGWNFNLKGDVQGTLRVQLEVHIGDLFNPYTGRLGYDEANLRSGEGEIYLPASQQGPFEEGETVQVYVKTGFDPSSTWPVKAYPPADRTDLDQTGQLVTTLGDDTSTYVSWTVPAGAFKVGSTNAWTIELWNSFFSYGFEQILTIDDIARAPLITDISYVNNADSMTYTVSCQQTYAALDHVTVYAWYGYGGTTMPPTSDTESWVLLAEQYPISGGRATFTVTPKNMDGTIVVKVIAYDVDGRPSTPGYESFIVEQGGTEPGDDPLEQTFVWTVLATILAALVAISLMAILLVAPVPMEIRVLLAAILGVAGAYIVWLAGTLQLGGIA